MESNTSEFELEKRMRHLEQELASFSVLLSRNSEILDDIRTHLNRPVNWPAWIGTAVTTLTLFGGLIYTAYIRPLEVRVNEIDRVSKDNRLLIHSAESHVKENRNRIEVLIDKVNKNASNGSD